MKKFLIKGLSCINDKFYCLFLTQKLLVLPISCEDFSDFTSACLLPAKVGTSCVNMGDVFL